MVSSVAVLYRMSGVGAIERVGEFRLRIARRCATLPRVPRAAFLAVRRRFPKFARDAGRARPNNSNPRSNPETILP
jgi:hypothetical protein